MRFTLPDTDVFSIDANKLTQTAAYAHVGTTLFNMAVNPVTGHLYVSNTEPINNVRFEGPGIYAGHTVQGHLAESRITVIAGATVTPQPSQQAPRLQPARGIARLRSHRGDSQPCHAARHGGNGRWQDHVRRRLRFEQNRRLRHQRN